MEESRGYFDRHGEQVFIAKSLAMVLFIIIAKDFLTWLFTVAMLVAPLAVMLYLRYQITTSDRTVWSIVREHVTLIPVMRDAEERKTEKIPWVTYILILTNIFIFYFIELAIDPRFIADNLVFLPEQPDFWNISLSAMTSMFLHSGNGHLWGNMTFLWAVGSAVERRIDSGSFFFLYLFTGLMGGILFVIVEYLAHGDVGHMLGASGAIAGIMGIYAVRCYFRSMIFPVPLLGFLFIIFPVSLKIRLNSLVIIGLFFYSDLVGGLSQLAGHHSGIGHWVHLGGMITGMFVAGLVLNLGDKAIEERHLELGVKAVETFAPTGEGEKSLSIALQQNPDCGEALLAMARLKSRHGPSPEGNTLYLRALNALVTGDPGLALDGYHEFVRLYRPEDLGATLLERLGFLAVKQKDPATAVKCFTMLSTNHAADPTVRERALYRSGRILEDSGEFDLAHERYAQLLREFPDADVAAKLRAKLADSPVAARLPEPEPPRVRERVIAVETRPPEPEGSRSCPACNGVMNPRRATGGSSQGALFWVCHAYPVCRQIIPVAEEEGLERTSPG